MFFHPDMTDAEILRTCEAVSSRHLRLLAERLGQRSRQLQDIARLCRVAQKTSDTVLLQSTLMQIESITTD